MSGDCFEVAAGLLLGSYRRDPTARLCHGTPIGTGEENEGQRYDHAWVEYEVTHRLMGPDERVYPVTLRLVVDKANGNDIEMPAAMYYKVGQLEQDHVVRYDLDQACKHMANSGHYGPWEGQP